MRQAELTRAGNHDVQSQQAQESIQPNKIPIGLSIRTGGRLRREELLAGKPGIPHHTTQLEDIILPRGGQVQTAKLLGELGAPFHVLRAHKVHRYFYTVSTVGDLRDNFDVSRVRGQTFD